MKDVDKKLENLLELAERYKQAHLKCLGAIEFLQKEKEEKKEEETKKDK